MFKLTVLNRSTSSVVNAEDVLITTNGKDFPITAWLQGNTVHQHIIRDNRVQQFGSIERFHKMQLIFIFIKSNLSKLTFGRRV